MAYDLNTDYDWSDAERRLKDRAQQKGVEYDPSDLEGAKRNAGYNVGGSSPEDAINHAFSNYDTRASSQRTGGASLPSGNSNPSAATSQYSGGQMGSGNGQLDALMSQLAGDRQQQQQERAGMREILMGQLGQLQQPVSPNDPGIRPVLDASRLTSQRDGERQQSAAAEQLGARGLSDSGAMDTMRLGIEEGRAERNQRTEADVLYRELNSRRQSLQQLLSQAMAIGDSESARNIQAQLTAIQSQMNQGNFQDDLAFRYTGLNTNANLQALMALMGAV